MKESTREPFVEHQVILMSRMVRIANEILMALRAAQKRKSDVSLQDPIGTDGDGNVITLTDVLGTDANTVPDEVDKLYSLQRMQKLIETLPKRERLVLEMRYGLLDGVSRPQHEIAGVLAISRSYVSRIEKHAGELLNEGLGTGGLGEERGGGSAKLSVLPLSSNP